MKLYVTFLLKLRNLVWDIRKKIQKDWFQTRRTRFYCGELMIPKIHDDIKRDFEDLLFDIGKTYIEYRDGERIRLIRPEQDCILQYEEDGQLCSFHYNLTDKHQLHVRLMESDGVFGDRFISVYAHKEIRPDYDPVAHIRGEEIEDGCQIWNQTKMKLLTKYYDK